MSKKKLLIFILLAISLSSLVLALPQVKTTDINDQPKGDYSPEEIVYIQASGFAPYEITLITVARPDHNSSTIQVVTNSSGGLKYAYDLDGIVGLYYIYTLQGNLLATTTFTDAAIWSTNADCGVESQDVNQYNMGNQVYLNGKGFSSSNYSWEIRGKPGLASCDPNIVVASGKQFVTNSQKFCFNAYNVSNNDCGEYQIKFSNKGDSYRVLGNPCTTNSQCGLGNTNLSCSGNGVLNTTLTPLCVNNLCVLNTSTSIVQTCSQLCSEGKCYTGDAACIRAREAGLLSGKITSNLNNVTANVTNNANASFDIGLATYKMFPDFFYDQELFDFNDTNIKARSNISIKVNKTACKTQVDLYCGHVVPTPFVGTPPFYGSRNIATTFIGTAYCSNNQSICGNGIREGTEQCDDGNQNNTDSCTNQCTSTFCGNGIREGTEQCDDGNLNNFDGCTNQCTPTICGDGIVQIPNTNGTFEQCDDANNNASDTCKQCTPTICGDGIVQIPNGNGQVEQCDDGNLNNTDSCSNSCTLQICGNGVVDNGELCDDGNENNNDACSNQCLPTICGDGIVQDPNSNGQAEQCDDGNTNNNDQCDNECNVCVDEDNDGVCIDQCPDSKPGEPVDENGCDNFQFCNQKGLSCGLECFHADFRNNEPDTEFPHDCTVVVPLKNGIESQPICVPTVSSDLCSN